jgi:hypothetical protein
VEHNLEHLKVFHGWCFGVCDDNYHELFFQKDDGYFNGAFAAQVVLEILYLLSMYDTVFLVILGLDFNAFKDFIHVMATDFSFDFKVSLLILVL